MKILLRESERKIRAFDPESGESLTKIPAAFGGGLIWCQDSLSTLHEHPEGIYWESWDEARKQLMGHEVITD